MTANQSAETLTTAGMVPADVPHATGAGPTSPVAIHSEVATFGLTKEQARLWRFIWNRQSAGEDTPTFDEMMAAMGLKSKGGVARLLDALTERGWMTREYGKARSVVALVPAGVHGRGAVSVAKLMLTELELACDRLVDTDPRKSLLVARIDLFRRLLNIAEAVQ